MTEQNVEGQPVAPVLLSVAAGATPLGYDAPRVYQASGRVAVGGLALVLGVGLVMAVLSAVVAWVWYYLRLPSFYVIPMIAQGVVLGVILGALCRRARLRNVPLAVGIGILCGMAAAASFQAVVYVRTVEHLPSDLGRVLEDRYGIVRGTPESEKALAKVRAAPFRAYDVFVLIPNVGRGGYRGFLKASSEEQWIFMVGQAVVVAGLAGWIAREMTSKPYCETCQRWYGDARMVAAVPLKQADALAAAVRADDPGQVLAVLRASPGEFKGERALSEVYRCGGCGQQLANVTLRTYAKNGKMKSKRLLPLHRVSSETATALKSEAAVVVEEENREDASDRGESLVSRGEDPHPNPPPEYRERG